jgi:lactoylglutathione lyase
VSAPVTTFAFTKLVVHDLERSARFYDAVFGMKELQRVQADIAGSPIDEIICGSDSGPGVILLRWLDGRPAVAGGVVLGFTTSGIGELFERVVAAGGLVRQMPETSAASGGYLVGFAEDPEGHLLEVVELP